METKKMSDREFKVREAIDTVLDICQFYVMLFNGSIWEKDPAKQKYSKTIEKLQWAYGIMDRETYLSE